MKRTLSILLAALLTLGLIGCGAKSAGESYSTATTPNYAQSAPQATANYGGYAKTEAMDAAEPYWDSAAEAEYSYSENRSESPNASLPAGVKMIYTASMELQSTEFDQAANDLAALVERLGGYFEQRSTRNYSGSYRNAYYTVRVPSAQFRAFLDQAGELCHVTECTENSTDVTEHYYDLDSRVKTAQIKLERLQELLSKADNMADIITIESAISDTEYTIEYLSGELRHYDALIDYATINVSLREVYKLTETEEPPMTFGAKIARSFREGLADFADGCASFAEWLAYSWLQLLVALVVLVIVVRLIRRLTRREKGEKKLRRTKKGKKGEQTEPAGDDRPETAPESEQKNEP